MLIVTMPTMPGAAPLSGVTQEADNIKQSLRNFSTVETFEQPTAKSILQALPGYRIAHFACHGVIFKQSCRGSSYASQGH
ncbi:hypothetical protein BGX38DRAFT_690837 [Terfezia claveryi]|nr:hypothetical protein BGX38DRAFT_690837 [Terfezia claveryi]